MSLIDEALKRAELEAARRDGLRGGAYPWIPEHGPRRRRRWKLVVLPAILIGAAAGGLWWFSRHVASLESPKAKAQGPKSEAAMETVEVSPPHVAVPARKPSRTVATVEAAQHAAADSPTEARAKKTVGSAAPGNAAPPRPAAPAAESRQAAHGLADGKTYVGEVAVPDGGKIALEGIVYSDTNPVALINGKVLPPGGVVEEFTIVSISSDRVELKGRGLTIFLALK